MTTAFDTKMAAVALRILTKFGVSSTLHNVVRGTRGEYGAVEAPDSTTDYVVTASPLLAVEASVQTGQGAGSASVLREEGEVYLRPFTTAGAALPRPQPKVDTFTTAGVRYRIVKVTDLRSGDDVAAYALTLVRS